MLPFTSRSPTVLAWLQHIFSFSIFLLSFPFVDYFEYSLVLFFFPFLSFSLSLSMCAVVFLYKSVVMGFLSMNTLFEEVKRKITLISTLVVCCCLVSSSFSSYKGRSVSGSSASTGKLHGRMQAVVRIWWVIDQVGFGSARDSRRHDTQSTRRRDRVRHERDRYNWVLLHPAKWEKVPSIYLSSRNSILYFAFHIFLFFKRNEPKVNILIVFNLPDRKPFQLYRRNDPATVRQFPLEPEKEKEKYLIFSVY